MEDGYLFKEKDSGKIHVGKEAQANEQGKFAEKRNEFLKRNGELQQSLWRGRDSKSMSDVKDSYRALNEFMDEEIPQTKEEFEERKQAITECYDSLITNCEAYIKSHKNPYTKEGKHRKAMVEAILSNASLEKMTLDSAFLNLSLNKEEGMIWGNLFGEMKENVELSLQVYEHFDNKYSEEGEALAGAKTMDLAKVISGSYAMDDMEDKEKSTMVSRMAVVWAQNNMSDDLKKEYKNFRTFVARILVNDYRTALAHGKKDRSFYKTAGDAEGDKQYTLLMLMTSEFYGFHMALKELAPVFGEDPLTCGINGEEIFNDIKEDPSYFDHLEEVKVRQALKTSMYYRRVKARSFLDGFADAGKLDEILGPNLKSRQTDAVPFDMKRPLPENAGKEGLEGTYDFMYFIRKINTPTIRREGAADDEPGEDTEEKWTNASERLKKKYGESVYVHDIVNASETRKIPGLNTARVFGALSGALGGDLKPADIEAVYDKILSRSRVGTGEGKITEAQANELFNEGVDELIDIYLAFLKRMEATYGRLIAQMHPEDILRQFGDELFTHFSVVQDTEQLKQYLLRHGNLDSMRVREFILLADYFFDINDRTMAYLGRTNGKTPEESYESLEGLPSVRNLLDTWKLDCLKGPQMTAPQKRKYNEDLKNRFKAEEKKHNDEVKKQIQDQKKRTKIDDKKKKKAFEQQLDNQLKEETQNWDLRLFSEFRGMKNG